MVPGARLILRKVHAVDFLDLYSLRASDGSAKKRIALRVPGLTDPGLRVGSPTSTNFVSITHHLTLPRSPFRDCDGLG
jgi:hypothetical protein